jgi:hypothetical protein
MPLIKTNKMDNKETKKLEERLNEGEFFGIDPSRGWDREYFVREFNRLGEVAKYEKQIKETKGEIPSGLKGDLSAVLNGNDLLTGQSDDIVRKAAKNAKKEGDRKMAEWARNNMPSLYTEIDSSEHADQMYLRLALTTPLCLTGDEKHDYTVGLMAKVKEGQKAIKAAQEGDISEMRKIVKAETKARKLPEWKKKLIDEFSNDDRLVQALFQESYQKKEMLVDHNLKLEDGKVDRNKIKSLISGSLSKKWHFYEDETHKDTKKEIYEQEIMPIYNAIAENAYAIAHDKYVKDKQSSTPGIEDLNKRAQERAKYGVGVGAEDVVKILEDKRKAAGGH